MARKKRPSQKRKTYIEHISKVPKDDKRINTTLFLPKTLGIKEIEIILKDYWKRNNIKVELVPEYGALMLDLIIKTNFALERYYKNKKNIDDRYEFNLKMKLAQGYAPIGSKQFEFWVNKDYYNEYKKAFEEAGIIENDGIFLYYKENKYNDPFFLENSKPYYWKITHKYYNKDEKEPYQKYKLKDEKVIWLQYKRKIRKYKETKAKANKIGRGYLVESAQNALMAIDTEMIIDYFTKNPEEYYELDAPDLSEKQRKEKMKYIKKKQKEGKKRPPVETYVERILNALDSSRPIAVNNVKDKFGRLHSFITNMPKVMRPHIPLNGSYDNVETDFTNSQMMQMAQIIKHPEKVKKILNDESLNDVIDLIASYKGEDIDEFVKHSMDGTIYEYVQKKLNFESRDDAKDRMFKMIFSDPKTKIAEFKEKNKNGHIPENYRKKYKDIHDIFPSLLRICIRANADQRKGIPEVLEKLEAKIVLDIIAPKFEKAGFGDIATIHDSYQYNRKFQEIAEKIIKETFDELGLSEPKFKHKPLNKMKVQKDG